MKKPAYFCYIFIFILKITYAQTGSVEQQSRFLTEVPFEQLSGGIIIVHALFDNFPDSLNFILDTGSNGVSLDSSISEYFHLRPALSDRNVKGIAGIHRVSFLYNHQLRINNLKVDSLDFHISNYEVLSQVYGERIDGIIGAPLMKRFVIKINYDSLTLSFYTIGKIRYHRGGYMLKPVINQLAVQQLKVKDEKGINARFLYDIGAGVCMLFPNRFVSDSGFISSKRKRWKEVSQGIEGNVDMELSVIKEIRIGPYRFRNVPILFFDDTNNVVDYPYTGGVIGNDILRRFNCVLNYQQSEIYIYPNSHYNEVFDYAYSGLEIFLVDGKIIAGEVAKDSPAEKAGIKEGDEILSIGDYFNFNLNQYKIALREPKERVRVIYRRNQTIYRTELKIKSIL
jgi:hypothetical protein